MNIRTGILAVCAAVLLAPAAALAADTATKTTSDAKPKKVTTEACQGSTGSRIKPAKPADCKASKYALRTYSSDELQRTGEIDLTEALRKLDPAFN
jgi:hypothetical protein